MLSDLHHLLPCYNGGQKMTPASPKFGWRVAVVHYRVELMKEKETGVQTITLTLYSPTVKSTSRIHIQ